MRKLHLLVAAFLVSAVSIVNVHAAEDTGQCKDVHFGYVDWPAVTVKTELASWMFNQMGYKSTITNASTPIIYQSLKDGDLDIFLAQWMPAQRKQFLKYGREGSIDLVGANLRGGKYTLGVPDYVYDSGIKSIDDLAAHKDDFKGKIYGIEPGSGGNNTIEEIIKDDYAGLGDWELVESSVAAMLSEVGERIKHHKPIVFLAWVPHPMNLKFDIRYLDGAADYWGPNKGEVIVNTLVGKGYAWKCQNVGQFLNNYTWKPKEQSTIMAYSINDEMDPLEAGKKFVREHPELLDRWFDQSGIYQTGGIKTFDGKQHAKSIIAKKLGIDK